jgi:hypothetical protein
MTCGKRIASKRIAGRGMGDKGMQVRGISGDYLFLCPRIRLRSGTWHRSLNSTDHDSGE